MSKLFNKNIQSRFVIITYIISLFFIVFFSFIGYKVGKEILFVKLQNQLETIVSLGVLSLDTNIIKKYSTLANSSLSEEDILQIEQQEDYKKLFSQIDAIQQSQSSIIQCPYILVPTNIETQAKFLVDCDIYEDRKNNSTQSIAHINFLYDISDQNSTLYALKNKEKIIDTNLVYDKEWNTYSLMGFAPIFHSSGEFLGVLGVDISDNTYILQTKQLLRFIIIIGCIFAGILLAISYYISYLFIKVSNLKNIQSNLQKSYNQLKKLDIKKTEFLNITSHELRTPITSISGYLSMILDGDMGEVSDEVKIYLRKVYGSSKRLGNLVNDMLDVAKLESGKIEILEEEFLINKILGEVIFDFEVQLQSKGQEFIIDIDTTKDIILKTDKNKLRQCIINLISNAYKYNKKNGTITIKTFLKNNFFVLEIIDTGIGIAPEHLDVIFEKFGQVKNSLTRDIDGTGLGLSIVKGFIEKLGGKIIVESIVGEGSTFGLYVPLKK